MVEDADYRTIYLSEQAKKPVELSEQEKFFKTMNLLMKWTCIAIFVSISAYAVGYGVDSTDAGAWNRSGVALRTDNLTGCEYLEGKNGGITPRMTNKGLHMGCRQ